MATDTKQVYLPVGLSLRSAAAGGGRFLWHFLQMVIAMMVGMAVYHLLAGKALVAYPILGYASMDLAMILPMVALMWYQGHGWQCSRDMVGTMLVGPAVLLACAQFGVHTYVPGLSVKTVLGVSDVTMYLGMLGAMLYHREMYSRPHAGHQHLRWPWGKTPGHASPEIHEEHRHGEHPQHAEHSGATSLETKTVANLIAGGSTGESIEIPFGITGMSSF